MSEMLQESISSSDGLEDTTNEPAYSEQLNKSYVKSLILEKINSEADSEEILSVFTGILKELIKEEDSHIKTSLIINNDIRSAYICSEARAAFSLFLELITR